MHAEPKRCSLGKALEVRSIARYQGACGAAKGAAVVEAAAVRYCYACPWHGPVGWARIGGVPPRAPRQCPECATTTETWVGTMRQVAEVSRSTVGWRIVA